MANFKIKDYEGLKIGSLNILKATKERCSSGVVFEAICKCGNKRTIPTGTIRRAIVKNYNPSCNKCKHSEIIITGNPEEASFRFLYKQYISSAKTRGYDFKLTISEFLKLTKENCFYCGSEPAQVSTTYNKNINGYYIYNGLDRVDNKQGYILSNVKPCCGICNIMKGTLSYSKFISQINKIHFAKACPSFDVSKEDY